MRSNTVNRGIERVPHRLLLKATGVVRSGEGSRPSLPQALQFVHRPEPNGIRLSGLTPLEFVQGTGRKRQRQAVGEEVCA